MAMIDIGATGTRNGLTDIQIASISWWMITETEPIKWLHHGLCVGADEMINGLARNIGWKTAGHPPIDERWKSDCYVDQLFPPKDYLPRDRDIVEASEILLVAPWQKTRPSSNRGSGTWTTFGYAEQLKKKVVLFWPHKLGWEVFPFHLGG